MNEEKTLSEQSKSKKITFFAAMLIVMGGSIGAGIFFKSKSVLSASHSSLILAIFCWIIASCAVICMALALVEISSARNDNLSLIGWSKVFNSRKIFKASKNFMVYIYLPLTYLFMPLYVIMSLQDGVGALMSAAGHSVDAWTFGTKADWAIWTVISLIMSVYFLTIPAIWSKVGDVQNKVVLAVKFLPLVFVGIIGFVLAFAGKGGVDKVHVSTVHPDGMLRYGASIADKNGMGAFFGVFLAISAIFFAYDGFYVAAGIQSEMKEPKKTPRAIFWGLAITTIIYLIIAISMSLNGNGSFFGMLDYFTGWWGDKAGFIVFGLINVCISIGVLGILNGFSMWAPRYVEDLMAEGELPLWSKYYKKLNPNKPFVGIVFSLALTLPIVLVFTLIGIVYIPNGDYSIYGSGMDKLYCFADLMANWTALFTFCFIATAIVGGIINRKTNKVVTDKKRYFKITGIIATIIVFAAMTVQILVPVVDMFALAATNKWDYEFQSAMQVAGGGDTLLPYVDLIVGRVMLVVTLLIFIGLSFGIGAIEDAVTKKKYGSIEKFEEYKKEFFANPENFNPAYNTEKGSN